MLQFFAFRPQKQRDGLEKTRFHRPTRYFQLHSEDALLSASRFCTAKEEWQTITKTVNNGIKWSIPI